MEHVGHNMGKVGAWWSKTVSEQRPCAVQGLTRPQRVSEMPGRSGEHGWGKPASGWLRDCRSVMAVTVTGWGGTEGADAQKVQVSPWGVRGEAQSLV